MRVVLVTGGFDPLHAGHLDYFREAKKLGSKLIVGLNSDEWLTRKKGRPFMSWEDRLSIIKELKIVDSVISFDDSRDDATAAIFKVLSTHHTGTKVIFANGGDRTKENIPEYKTYGDYPWVDFAFGVGGENKRNSSSWILDNWKTQKTERDWGYWRVLDDKQPNKGIKVKELVINPGGSLSDQKHFNRSEYWYILEGSLSMKTEWNNNVDNVVLKEHSTYIIEPLVWHQASNPFDEPCHVLEVQYGTECQESDIERRN